MVKPSCISDLAANHCGGLAFSWDIGLKGMGVTES